MPDKKIGFLHATALVSGNMIGTGILFLPASLAVFGYFSLWGWLISTVGAVTLAIVFARLSKLLPFTGGLYIYVDKAFGPLMGFIIGWGYWIAVWTGNAAIVITLVATLSSFFPFLNQSPLAALSIGIAVVWIITFINLKGIKEAAQFQMVTTILKIIPLVIIGTVGFFYFKSTSFWVRPQHISYPAIFLQTAALTLWSFLGLESATVPAEHIRNPEKNIAKATIIGTVLAAVIYIFSSTAVMGILTNANLAKSTAPFADAAEVIGGNIFYTIIAVSAVIACLGTLNGWILMQGQVAYAVATNGAFPSFFKKKNRNNVPTNALIISSALTCVVIGLNYSKSLQEQFQNLILLSTLSTLIPYVFCSVAELMIKRKMEADFSWRKNIKLVVITIIAFLFSIGAIIGTGPKSILYGVILLNAGVPIYYLFQKMAKKNLGDDLAVDKTA
ncbi:amino acid permease [Solitalea sp. MAHUQ-68]|uniref:Arginine/agmatine antiporter n=1 Tax=Solitalea agri TaxID=2953739 RepID=A0A9X2F4L6_9SPHI|nr:amino acid permease [Solitalea agri]MCO4291738.1 amino acid permease [Solitalea agri]